ncbi:hypothetical protein SAMN06893096_103455 [Geodermatophilus pulveris]|uniref:Uncharacterized protein n=1 Tax=Geodermatophilus pulveris TaxID=1564159 RepID=A0A239E075_9ACTN|nr:hypothetical protein SAMN06893096_103455 [Geodermatophilus pulveris]
MIVDWSGRHATCVAPTSRVPVAQDEETSMSGSLPHADLRDRAQVQEAVA